MYSENELRFKNINSKLVDKDSFHSQTVLATGRVTPSPRTSITASSSDASRQVRRRSSFLRNRWSWPWPLERQVPAPCCSAPRTPTASSSCRWRPMMMMVYWPACSVCCCENQTIIFICVFSPGSGCVSGGHGKSISCNRQPSAHHQVFLLSYVSPIRGRYSHRTELLHPSLLPPHA